MADIPTGSNPILNFAAQAAQTQARTIDNATAITAQNDAVNNATTQDLNAVDAAASAQQVVQAATDSVKLQTSSENASAKAMLGADPNAANYRLQSLQATQQDAYEKTQALSGIIAQKQSATLLSDPLGFINAQFTLPADIAQHNYYAGLHNAASQEYDDIVSKATNTAQENEKTAATMTAAQASANQDLITAKAAETKATIQQNAAQLNTKGILDLQTLNEQQLSNSATAVNVADAQTRIGLAQQQMALTNQTRLLQQQMLQERIDAKTASDSELADTAASYNTAAARLGGTPLPATVVAARLKRGDPTVSQFVRYGQDIGDNGGNAEGVPVAATPAQAGALYTSSKIVPNGTTSSTMSYLAEKVNEFAGNSAIASEKDPNVRLGMINKLIDNDVTNQAKAISDNKPNIYAAPSVAALVSSVPALANNSFINGVLLPKAQANPDAPSSANDIVTAAVAAINKDPSQLNDVAQGIANFYNASIYYNNKMKGYGENGLPLQTNYLAQLNTGFLGRSQTLDLSNPTVVKTLLMRLAYGNQVNMTNAVPGIGLPIAAGQVIASKFGGSQ